MGAYDRPEVAIAGLQYGANISDKDVISRFAVVDDISPGDPLFGYEGDDVNCYQAARDTLILTFSADLVALNVTTLTLSAVTNGVDDPQVVAETFDTDHDTTMDNLVAAIEAAYPNATVTLTDAINNRQITIQQNGANWTGSGVVTLGVSQATITPTYTTAQIFIGVAVFNQISTITTRGIYPQGFMVDVLNEGKIYVPVTVAVNAYTDAFVIFDYTTPANQGKFTNVSSGNYETMCRFLTSTSGAGLAAVEVNKQHTDLTP